MNEQAAIRIFLVDDQSMIRAGFRSLLSVDGRFQVVGDSGDPRAAIDAIGKLRPDVVLLDISMPGLSGLDAIAMIRKVHPAAKVIMLTHHEGESFVTQALSSGADGYLSKDSEQSELVLAIDAVRRGNPFISPKVAGSLLRRGGTKPDDASGGTRLEGLTPREREVFQLLALGKSNKEVAKALSTSLGTVKKHRENLQRKLNCHSTAEMALLAMREGLMGS
ncbi:MAG TPA: response regulator transcription factor [Planctomycetota bacterium]|jgi:DNA-binding NarL/FixJ family response regulator|nr:response regulator transcription factor [Planctomycetota bacterium]